MQRVSLVSDGAWHRSGVPLRETAAVERLCRPHPPARLALRSEHVWLACAEGLAPGTPPRCTPSRHA